MTDASWFWNARHTLGLTQQQMADAVGLEGADAHRLIRRIEAGKKPLTGTMRRTVELLLERDRPIRRENND